MFKLTGSDQLTDHESLFHIKHIIAFRRPYRTNLYVIDLLNIKYTQWIMVEGLHC